MNEEIKKQPETEFEDFASPDPDGRFLCWVHIKIDGDGYFSSITGTYDFQRRLMSLTDLEGTTSVYELSKEIDPCVIFELIGDRTHEGWVLIEIDFYKHKEN